MKWLRWLLVLLILAGLYWWLTLEKPIQVDVLSPSLGLVESTVANTRSGTITACQRAKMSLPIGGQIASINVKEGDIVDKGHLLISLWNKDRLAKLEEVKALFKASQSEQKRACLMANQAESDYQRQQTLLKNALTSQENLDLALTNFDARKASCQASIAKTTASQAMVDNINASIEQTYLVAPFKGIIAEITGEIGEYTTPSPPGVPTPPAVDILTHDCHYVTAPIDEVDAGLLTVGKPVKITLDAFRGRFFSGKLRRISPYIQDYEKQARTVTIEVAMTEHSDPHLLAGFSADVEVILEAKENVLRLPSDLIINNEYVLVLNGDGFIERRNVEIGIGNWQFSEIVSGLTTKDKVIASIGLSGVEIGAFAEAKK
ncbi:efflux RND transporter periplasmic adaptor subunit [Thalassotalea ganghwensis]